MSTTLDLDRSSTWLEIKGNVATQAQAGLLRSKFDDDCIWMIRNAPYLSCPNWEDRRKSLTHIFTFVVASSIQGGTRASFTVRGRAAHCGGWCRAAPCRGSGGSNRGWSNVTGSRFIPKLGTRHQRPPKIPLEFSSRKHKPIFTEICSTWTWTWVSFSLKSASFFLS